MINPEITLVYISIAKLLIIVLIAFVYARAGRGWKIWGIKIRRRIIIPFILLSAILLFASIQKKLTFLFLLSVLLSCPIYFGTLSIGYGKESWLRKVFGKLGQRIICHSLVGGSCVLIAFVTGNWWIYSLSVGVGCIIGTILGYYNPVDAAEEENLIAIGEFLFPLFLI